MDFSALCVGLYSIMNVSKTNDYEELRKIKSTYEKVNLSTTKIDCKHNFTECNS